MHGHDVGVWVCEGSGLSLSPVLFMQVICPEPQPRALLVKWKHATAPPRPFQKDRNLRLVYSEPGRLPPWPYHLHLFAPQAPVARAMEQATDLQDWSLSVPVIGVVLIFNQKYDRPPSAWSFGRLLGRSQSPKPNQTLAWVQNQHAPYVIAALGYDEATTSVEQLRSQHNLAVDIPVIAGPELADTRRRTAAGDSGMFSSIFERQKIGFDRDYARAVLEALFQRMERER